MGQMPATENIPDVEQIPDMQKITASEKKRHPLHVYDAKIPATDQMPAKKQNRKKCPYYEIEEELMADSNYRNMWRSMMLLLFMRT